jgi:tetratricopeptide (TPR) repeat protein
METLLLELGRYPDVQVSLQSDLAPETAARNESPRFSLRGRIRQEDGELRVTARLVDHTSGAQVWGDEYFGKAGPGRWSGSLDDIGRVIAARVGGEEGVVMQLLAAEHRTRRLAPLTPHRAIMLSHRFSLTHDPESLAAAFHALRQVVAEEPACGPAWSRLAGLCLTNYALEVTTLPTSLDDAVSDAQRGLSVDPVSRRARCVLAAAQLIKGELGAARQELEMALRLTPDSLVYLEVVGHLLSLLGDGKRGPALVRRARDRNPHCLPHGSFGLWFDHLRRGELEAAYEEALAYRDPAFFWRAVMRASCLAHLGRLPEAELEVAEILRERPDFAARGRVLIGRFIKFPEVMGQIIGGLAKAGLKLA